METLAEYKVHMDGLQRMIELRGGLDVLGYGGVLKNWYQWCNMRLRSESARGTVMFKAISVLPGDITVLNSLCYRLPSIGSVCYVSSDAVKIVCGRNVARTRFS